MRCRRGGRGERGRERKNEQGRENERRPRGNRTRLTDVSQFGCASSCPPSLVLDVHHSADKRAGDDNNGDRRAGIVQAVLAVMVRPRVFFDIAVDGNLVGRRVSN